VYAANSHSRGDREFEMAVVPQNLIRRIYDSLKADMRIRQLDVDVAGVASRRAAKTP